MKAITLFAVALILAGCATTIKPYKPTKAEMAHFKAKKPLVLCKCGEIKGNENCCKSGLPLDQETGFNQDSMCHRIIMTYKGDLTKDELDQLYSKDNVTLCPTCGHLKGTKKCCKKTAPKCKVCGFDQNSIRAKIINSSR